MNTTLIGNLGEDAACAYLIKQGYRIIERNYKCKIAEIDIKAVCSVEEIKYKNGKFNVEVGEVIPDEE